MDLGYIHMQLDGKIIGGNAAIKNILGYPKVKGLNFFKQWVKSSDSDNFVSSIISDKVVRNVHVEIKHQDNSISFLSINAQLLIQEDHKLIECVISLCSERKQSSFVKTCKNMSRSLSQLIDSQIASVVGTAEMLRLELMGQTNLNPKFRTVTNHNIPASKPADHVNPNKPTYHDVCLHQLSIKLAETYQSSILAAKQKNISYNLKKESYSLLGNEKEITKLLLHLIDNAIDATSKHGRIVISNNITTLKEGNKSTTYLMLAVEDDGHGIDKETQQRIFKPSFTTRSKRRGMSLTHVKRTVKMFQGRIQVKSIVDKGTIIKVLFPISTPDSTNNPTIETMELPLPN